MVITISSPSFVSPPTTPVTGIVRSRAAAFAISLDPSDVPIGSRVNEAIISVST